MFVHRLLALGLATLAMRALGRKFAAPTAAVRYNDALVESSVPVFVAGRSFAEMPLNLKLELGAKGELAKNLEALRVLDAPAAEAAAGAYRAMSEPLVLDGTLRQIGTAQVSRLLTRALGL